jgi:uncharacterized membrane protein
MDTVGLIMAERVSSIDTMSEQNERLLGFSDAVFAIAMTFLALELGDTPESLGEPGGDSVEEFIRDRVSAYGVYFGTFLVVAFLWWRHHLIFRYIKRSSKGLVWLNVAMLALVALLPYPAQLLGESESGSALALFVLLVPLILIGLLLWLQWELALKQQLTIPTLPSGTIKYVRSQLMNSPLAMGVAAALAAISWKTGSDLAYGMSLGMWPVLIVVAMVWRQIWPVPEQATEIAVDNVDGEWSAAADVDEEEAKRVRTVLARVRNGSDTDRLKVLTDGVVAIAVTILALQLRPPAVSVITDETILASLKVVPWVNYLTTFLLISVFWMAHVRIFRRVLGADTILLWFNLFFLMFVSFLPTAAVLQNAKEVPETVVIYWLSMFFTSVSLIAISVYATYGKKLAVAAASEVDSVALIIRSVSLAGAFLGVAGLVWVTQTTSWALAVYIVLFINGRFGRRIAVKVVAHRHRDPVSPGVAS